MPAEVKKKKARSTRKPHPRKPKASPPAKLPARPPTREANEFHGPVTLRTEHSPKMRSDSGTIWYMRRADQKRADLCIPVIGPKGSAGRVVDALKRFADKLPEIIETGDLPPMWGERPQSGGVSVNVLWRAADSPDEIAEYRGEKLLEGTGCRSHPDDYLGGSTGADIFNVDVQVQPTGPGDCHHCVQRLCVTGPKGTIERFAEHIERSALAFAVNGNAGGCHIRLDTSDITKTREFKSFREGRTFTDRDGRKREVQPVSDQLLGADALEISLGLYDTDMESCAQQVARHTIVGPVGTIEVVNARLIEFLRDFAKEGG